MIFNNVTSQYFDWLHETVCGKWEPRNLSFHSLLMFLFRQDFIPSCEMDESRAEDGCDLRYRFAQERNVPYAAMNNATKGMPCSMLEMIVALSIRIEEHIMADSEAGNRVGQWFWSMIVSLGMAAIYYDDKAVEGFVKFCENELTLTDGGDLKLLDSFKLWAEEIFGWYYFVDRSIYVPNPGGHGGHYERKRIKKRLITKQYLIIPRGAAKTMYDAFIQSYFLTVDVSTTQQCTTAPTMKQAEEVLSPIRTALARSKGPLFKFMTEGSLQNTTGAKSDRVKLASTKKGIENFLTNSLLEVRPMTIDKLQGRRDRVATVDEWLSCDIREDPISALEQGASKNEDYLIVATSSEGTVRNGCGDTIKMELMDILKGEYINPHVSIWYYKLDSIDEVTNPEMWLKANPNLGQTVSYETYQLDVERAEKAPGSRNDILAKRFNIPMEGYTYFFPYEETLPHRHRDYWQMPCASRCRFVAGR